MLEIFRLDKPWVYLLRLFEAPAAFHQAGLKIDDDRGRGENVEAGLRRESVDGVETDESELADEFEHRDHGNHDAGQRRSDGDYA